MSLPRTRLFMATLALSFSIGSHAQSAAQLEPDRVQGYQQAPQPIHDILAAAPTPVVVVSPGSEYLLVGGRLQYPPISDLAQPMLRLAGLRINPVTNGRHHPPRVVGLSLVEVATGKTRKVSGLPKNAYLSAPEWSPDGKRFAFTNATGEGTDLWLGDVESASAAQVSGFKINSVLGEPVEWMPDGLSLLIQTVPASRGNPPEEVKVPDGPIIQESDGKKAPVRTYEDLLANPHDEALFDYYATSQLQVIHHIHNAKVGPIHASMLTGSLIGKPAVFARVEASPDGQHFLVTRIRRPYSYIVPQTDFPREIEVWNSSGKLEFKVASQPLADHVPIEGVLTGPRDVEWVSTRPATLVWAEALDGGDPKNKVPFRDQLLTLGAPFKQQPAELLKMEQRFMPGGFGAEPGGSSRRGIEWGENGIGLVRDYDRDRRWTRTFLIDINQAGKAKLVWERSIRERYKDPGEPVMRTLPNGKQVLRQHGGAIFLTGAGASPKGEFPFLDRYDLETGKTERIFQCSDKSFESVAAVAADDGSRFITRYETPTDPPNYFARTAGSAEKRALTSFPDPAPQLRNLTKRLVTYKRADGIPLSFTLYLPANYKQGERLPTIVWAYPLEFNDAATAGQVSGSPYHFTTITGIANIHLLLITQGYAVLDGATMPVVGDPETMNNTYIEQIVSSAKAAIDKAVEMGVTDPNRVGVGGHSYGAFMTANLLAHSDLFRAGVARSGAYNRTLTPFGFQSERRTFWEAPEMYMKVSPFASADKISHPILLIHGMADDNSGTFPIQSERMYQAIKGNGGIVRYVQLPLEAHGYLGRESIEHVLWEMTSWFDHWVKNPEPETHTAQTTGQ